LGVTTRERSAVAPDLPTIDEAGLPGYEMATWYGLFVQGATPRGVIAKLQEEVAQDPRSARHEGTDRGRRHGGGREHARQFAEFLKRETEKYARIIEAAGIKAID